MRKSTAGRAAGFVGAMGVTAGLVAAGVNMTGAFFQDAEQGTVRASTGEVDISVDGSTPLTSTFGPLMPGGQGASNTYTVTNTGTGPVDLHLGSANWDAFSPTVISLDLDEDGDGIPDQPAGISHEFNVPTVIGNGDTISFEYRLGDGQTCAGGVPRVFVQNGAYNTFDIDPAGPLACGVDPEGDGWFTVTQAITGITTGAAGNVGLVNDQIANPGLVEYRALTLNGVDLLGGAPFDICTTGDQQLLVRVIGPNHDSGNLNLCNLPNPLPPLAQNVAPGGSANLQVVLSLSSTAENNWANKVGTADLFVIGTQAGQGVDPTNLDQVGNDDA